MRSRFVPGTSGNVSEKVPSAATTVVTAQRSDVRSACTTTPGTALPGVVVHAERTSDLWAVTTVVAADGTFSLTFPLVPGTNRLRITEDGPGGSVHGWIGNSYEFGMDTCITHAVCVPK